MEEHTKDPVCGSILTGGGHPKTILRGATYSFCGEDCKEEFLADPDAHLPSSLRSIPHKVVEAKRIAYFSMEVGVDSRLPTYSGGLGVLAGDFLKACADLKIPLVAVSLLYGRGYFEQFVDASGEQTEKPVIWDPSLHLQRLPEEVKVSIEGRQVTVTAWQYAIIGASGYTVPLIYLDTNLYENAPEHRELSYQLYGGDKAYRLAQEVILGIGGVRMLRALGYHGLRRFHMNEGHAGLLTIELARESNGGNGDAWDVKRLKRRCIFTTHTPVPAGHDRFPYDLVERVMGSENIDERLRKLGGEEELNMTLLALKMSRFANAVAKRHGQVSREMFPGYHIESITNGVHSRSWTSRPFRALFDRHIPGWVQDPSLLRHAVAIPEDEIWASHQKAKTALAEEIVRKTDAPYQEDVLTIGVARRVTPYKRTDLIFHDIQALAEVVESAGPLQIVFAGKAHPQDEPGKEMIRHVYRAAKELSGRILVLYLADYGIPLARLMTSGVDLWLNTPEPPLEASGTSGMKAAHNGIPSLSVLDGWWIEGHLEGITGWSIGPAPGHGAEPDRPAEAAEIYRKLGDRILPLYYNDRKGWIDVMRHAIALNASYFNTHRMAREYATRAYL